MSRKRNRQIRPNWNAGINAPEPTFSINWGNSLGKSAKSSGATTKNKGDVTLTYSEKCEYFRFSFGKEAFEKMPIGHRLNVTFPEPDVGRVYLISSPNGIGKRHFAITKAGKYRSSSQVSCQSDDLTKKLLQYLGEYKCLKYDKRLNAFYLALADKDDPQKENHINADTGK